MTPIRSIRPKSFSKSGQRETRLRKAHWIVLALGLGLGLGVFLVRRAKPD